MKRKFSNITLVFICLKENNIFPKRYNVCRLKLGILINSFPHEWGWGSKYEARIPSDCIVRYISIYHNCK